MCIAIPAKIISITNDVAIVNYGGVELKVNISFIDNPKIDDYLLIHAGCAIEKIDEDQAIETLKIFKELEEAIERR